MNSFRAELVFTSAGPDSDSRGLAMAGEVACSRGTEEGMSGPGHAALVKGSCAQDGNLTRDTLHHCMQT